jgi:pyrroline-5-carboxylate reductase
MTSPQKITGTIGFLGFGNMGGAVARGAVAAGLVVPENILVYDPGLPSGALESSGFGAAGSAEEVFQKSEVILLAVKPQVFKETAAAWTELVSGFSGKTVISVMAGIRVDKLRSVFPGFAAVRVMPNLGLSVGEGATAIATDGVGEDSLNLVEAIFQSCGTTVRVMEEQMDAVTALSGSGPMYVFEFIEAITQGLADNMPRDRAYKTALDIYSAGGESSGSLPNYLLAEFIEALARSGVASGLPYIAAYQLAKQTFEGALKLLKSSSDMPSIWTARVCSPGGTTLAALKILEEKEFRERVMDAVRGEVMFDREAFREILMQAMEPAVAAAKKRSEELSG